MKPTLQPCQRGVSLIEALVALAVMAIGILGVVGVQVSLRANADIARQRAEAVRIAQEAVEAWRGYTVLASTAGQTAYQDIVSTGAQPVTSATTNTTFQLTRTVVDARAGDASEPRLRTLVVDVAWADRTGQTQSIRISTRIGGVAPELAGSLGVPGEGAATRLPGGRNPAIPPTAVDNGNGTSTFTPPGSSGVTWTFDNLSGVITTQICVPLCTDNTALLLSGFVLFNDQSLAPPTAVQAENPNDDSHDLQVGVDLTLPAGLPRVNCFTQRFPKYVAYYCAMPVSPAPTTSPTAPLRWSGQSTIAGLSGLATNPAETSKNQLRVCRYTPGRNEDANGDGVADGDKPLRGNVDHPRQYSIVTGPLVNQNFLVIRAGDDSLAFDCPGDDTGTPFVNGNTWQHQPHT
jgi:prepilin-type N-terminal cleavage/methylation domain-containing protein